MLLAAACEFPSPSERCRLTMILCQPPSYLGKYLAKLALTTKAMVACPGVASSTFYSQHDTATTLAGIRQSCRDSQLLKSRCLLLPWTALSPPPHLPAPTTSSRSRIFPESLALPCTLSRECYLGPQECKIARCQTLPPPGAVRGSPISGMGRLECQFGAYFHPLRRCPDAQRNPQSCLQSNSGNRGVNAPQGHWLRADRGVDWPG
jgi:hypothetical protein